MENPARKIKKICELTLATLFFCGCSSIKLSEFRNNENADNYDTGRIDFSNEQLSRTKFLNASRIKSRIPDVSKTNNTTNRIVSNSAKAGRFFYEFPFKMEMVGKVKKYESRNAKHCLIHMLQMHVTAFNRRKPYNSCMDEKTLEKINEVQNDIYDVLLQLKYDYGINEIYQEALYEDEKIWDDRQPKRKLFYYLEYPKTVLNEEIEFWNHKVNIERKIKYEEILKEKLRFRSTFGERYPFLAGASFLMADDELIRLKYGESKDFYLRELNRDLSFGAEKDNHEKREDFLLETIKKNGDEIAAVVYGGSHCWKNNIKKWNKVHKTEKFSLIEIVPDSYYRLYGNH